MSQDIIGRAWVGVGIRDETRAALAAMRTTLNSVLRDTAQQGTRALQPLDHAIQRIAQPRGGRGGGGGGAAAGKGGFGAGRSGGREFGSFSGWNQIAFGLEDAVVSYQLNGVSGAMRAASNNVTMMALAFGGLRAQMLATALVVGAQLAPAFFKWQGQLESVEKTVERIKASVAGMRSGFQSTFDRSLLGDRMRDIGTSDAALGHMGDLRRKIGQIENVDRPAAQLELNTLRGMLADFKRLGSTANWADQFGNLGKQLFAGGESDADRVRGLQDEIAARERLIQQLDRERDTLGAERSQTVGRLNELRSQEAGEKAHKERNEGRESLETLINSILGDVDPLIDEHAAQNRANSERNRRLGELFGQAGIDGSDTLFGLDRLDRMRMQKGPAFNGLPDTLSEFSVAGQRQFALNQGNQNDPALQVQKDIKRAAEQMRDKLDDLLFELRGDE